ncbi:maleylacetoacetate isomerase [Ruegeria sp.]|uniref:maleylacetoacetate isomerase n=1 Tax=Ruegeria sp. TaxID=1879320 RepID=UPI0023268F21|nr:maleylacetoacetate isomerase [Ruegeria sp.]MDA7966182.1 maleylacetoacetate isomerase [Ruegeria sp.]
MRLYGYWRSSAAYRLRIALGLKGLGWEDVPVHLVKGEQQEATYLAKNPIGLVPTLELDDGTLLTQSLAILDWLEEVYPTPALLPSNPLERARVRAAAHTIAVDTHPIQNAGVVKHLKTDFGASQEQGIAWMTHWMKRGFAAFQALAAPDTEFAMGDAPSLADICLIPQLYNAHRWGLDLAPYPRLTEIERNCLALPAFANAVPEAQPDAE